MHKTLTLALVLLLGATAVSAEVIDRIVAVVGGQIITRSDVDAAATFGLAANLQELIDRTLMLNELRRVAPPEPPAPALEARLARMRANFATPQAFARALDLSGLNEEAVKAYAADDLRLSAYLDDRFSSASQPSDDAVRSPGDAVGPLPAAERRQALVNAWVAELRRRAEITVLQ